VCAPYRSHSVESVFNNAGYLIAETEATKVQYIAIST